MQPLQIGIQRTSVEKGIVQDRNENLIELIKPFTEKTSSISPIKLVSAGLNAIVSFFKCPEF